ncbi:MAG: archease [Nanoarchaeota archaeon]
MKKFKFLEDVAIADIAFEAYGKNLNEVFENSAYALFDATANIKTVKQKIKKVIKLKNKDEKDLLYNFLSELIYLKDSKQLIFSKVKVNIKNDKLQATLYGDKINPEKQELRNDIKAVTLHMFNLEKTKTGYKITTVLDV